MTSKRNMLNLTVAAAWFALREYFAPLFLVMGLWGKRAGVRFHLRPQQRPPVSRGSQGRPCGDPDDLTVKEGPRPGVPTSHSELARRQFQLAAIMTVAYLLYAAVALTGVTLLVVGAARYSAWLSNAGALLCVLSFPLIALTKWLGGREQSLLDEGRLGLREESWEEDFAPIRRR